VKRLSDLLEDHGKSVGPVGEEDLGRGVAFGLVAGDAGEDEVGDAVRSSSAAGVEMVDVEGNPLA
jgi:hypothetical protein